MLLFNMLHLYIYIYIQGEAVDFVPLRRVLWLGQAFAGCREVSGLCEGGILRRACQFLFGSFRFWEDDGSSEGGSRFKVNQW